MPVLSTRHGALELPVFLPDATRGFVKTLDSADVAAAGVRAVVVNAFHLSNAPGSRTIEHLGGIHSFMDWKGPVFSDSGGFQLWSLISDQNVRGKITRKGFEYRARGRDEVKLLTPEKSILWQRRIGSDAFVCLDHCTSPDLPPEAQRASVEHTVAWAEKGRATRDRLAQSTGLCTPLFAVVQGGNDLELRRECAERLQEIGFDGYAFGGWPVDAEGGLVEAVAQVAQSVPRGLPLWGLGIGSPENLVAAARLGYNVFDCVMPTRDARHGRVFRFREAGGLDGDFHQKLYLADVKHRAAAEPIDESCPALCCRRYSRAYLHHLALARDPGAARLMTIHNLAFYSALLDRIRACGEDKARL